MIRDNISPPELSKTEIRDILEIHFGWHPETIVLLPGDIGLNALVRHQNREEFVLKIANPMESRGILDAQNQALQLLQEHLPDFRFPQPVPNRDGDTVFSVQDTAGNSYHARLMTFVPGTFLSELSPVDPELAMQMGDLFGKIDRVLTTFDHEACHRLWHWDLRHLADLRNHLPLIQDARLRRLVDYFLLQFETHVRPQIPLLRQSIIHNDGNEHNVLVSQENGSRRISGLIDFGDIVYTCTIFEAAIVLAYLMMDQSDPLAVAGYFLQAYHRHLPFTEAELTVLFYAIAGRLCASLLVATVKQSKRPHDEYGQISTRPAQRLLERLIAINPIAAENRFRQVCGLPSRPEVFLPIEKMVERRHRHISPVLSLSYKKPLHIVRGAMQYLFDDTGQTYLDCVNNVCHVGHCHPLVVRAIARQAADLNTNTRYLHRNIIELAEQLTATLPEPLSVCFFVNSGSEANELALRLARTHTGRTDCLVVDGAYHGNTDGLVEISPYKFDGPGGRGAAPHVHKVPMPDLYRGRYRGFDPLAGAKYAAEVAKEVERLCAEGRPPGFFIAESLLSCGGQIVLPDGYLSAVYQAVREAGGVCIADEVQVGFGRVGDAFWGFQLQGVVPDIVTMGKPFGNGHPLAAVVTTPEIAASFQTGMEYFNTFGGNPVSCAAGLAVLEVIEDEGLQENARRVGAFLLSRLQDLQQRFPLIGDVRGRGLFLGIELVRDQQTLEPAAREAKLIIEAMKERGILLSIDGPLRNVIKIKPPLVFTEENANQVVETLEQVLEVGKRMWKR